MTRNPFFMAHLFLARSSAPRIAPTGRSVKDTTRVCSEHIICPVPRAHEMSALSRIQRRDRASQGGGNGLCRSRGGAGHEAAGNHLACVEREPDLVAGGGHSGPRSPYRAALAGAL